MAKEVVVKREPEPETAADAVVPAPVAQPAPMISFDRWFSSTGKPAHHKAGLKAFTNTEGKRTLEAWNKLFGSY